MAGRRPSEIWELSLDEGERRLARGDRVLLSTGLVGGLDVMLGILVLALMSGALHEAMPERTAHALSSLTFGIAFVFIAIGRSELFTENFLVPVAAVIERRRGPWSLARLWGITLPANLVGLAALAYLLSIDHVLQPGTLEAAGTLADAFTQRGFLAALASAVVAGSVMTLFTWLLQAAERDTARVLVALIIGFLLAAPSLNHAVVGFGEVIFGLAAGTAGGSYLDLAQNLGVAVLGNLLGGFFFVTFMRLVQARAPDSA